MKINSKSNQPVTVNQKDLEEVTSFTYLGSIVNTTGGTEEDVKCRIGKARSAFHQLRNIWKSREITAKTKLRIFNSNVKSVPLYGSETWRLNQTTINKIQTFINRCLRRILNIYWPNTISNEDLWIKTKQEPIEIQIKRRKWKWIGHTLRKPTQTITRQAISWNPQGKRKRGRPKNTWRRELEKELAGHNWKTVEKTAQDRIEWRRFVGGLCSGKE